MCWYHVNILLARLVFLVFFDFSRFLLVLDKIFRFLDVFFGFGQEPDICKNCLHDTSTFPESVFCFGCGQNAAKLGVCKNPTLTGSLSEKETKGVLWWSHLISCVHLWTEAAKSRRVLRPPSRHSGFVRLQPLSGYPPVSNSMKMKACCVLLPKADIMYRLNCSRVSIPNWKPHSNPSFATMPASNTITG